MPLLNPLRGSPAETPVVPLSVPALTPVAAAPAPHAGLDPAAVLKVERADRRDQLYAVVREAMAQAGFVAAGYSFKLIALDADAWHFLVLVDLSPALASAEARPEQVEAQVVQQAMARARLQVDGVYWRPAASAAAPGAAAPAGDSPACAEPAAPSASAGAPSRPAPFEPLQDDEVAAFQRALAEADRPGKINA